jgi:hypothetical protein
MQTLEQVEKARSELLGRKSELEQLIESQHEITDINRALEFGRNLPAYRGELEIIESQLNALDRAAEVAQRNDELEKARQKKEFGKKLRKAYMAALRAEYMAFIELGKAIEKAVQFQEQSFRGEDPKYFGLPRRYGLEQRLNTPGQGLIWPWYLAAGIACGAISREDFPAHWRVDLRAFNLSTPSRDEAKSA